jgi:monovalent cation:proton antiporter-2 (CPA2) family protein
MILVGTIKMWKSVVFITISSCFVISTINTVESFSTNGGLTGLSGLTTTVKKCSSSTNRVHYYSGKHHGWKENRRPFAVPSRATTTNFQQRYAGTALSFDMADEVNKHDESNSVARKNKKNILHVWRKLLHATICTYSNLVKSLVPIKRNNRKLYKLVSSLLLACSLIFASSTSSSFASSSSSLIKFNNSPTPTTATTTQVIQGTCKAVSARGGDMTKMLGGISGGAAKVINKKKSTVAAAATMTKETSRTFREAFQDLTKFLRGPKSDTLWLLSATALITPIMKKIGASPILGFLATGMLLGPNGFGVIRSIHTTEILAELGIVFFLFEMGIELSVERLMSMKRDVFGLGLGQFVVSALAFALTIGRLPWPSIMPKLGNNALVVLGGGLALSSSAFVLQLLKDKDQLKTRFGKASFGVLLFQDLAVVPLLVVTPILAGKGSVARAVTNAVIKAAMALGSIEFVGRFVLNPLFRIVAQAKSQEAFLSMVLLTVLSMSFLTEGLGLSNTLGAFLAGVLISETKYKYQVEADIAPFRGVLLGLFFLTVGFEIDVKLIAAYPMLVSSIVLGIIGIKSAITTALSMAFGLSLANAQQTGLITSQGGEFAFVAFGLAKALGILDPTMTKVMLTSVSLTMALTPFLASLSGKVRKAS